MKHNESIRIAKTNSKGSYLAQFIWTYGITTQFSNHSLLNSVFVIS